MHYSLEEELDFSDKESAELWHMDEEKQHKLDMEDKPNVIVIFSPTLYTAIQQIQ